MKEKYAAHLHFVVLPQSMAKDLKQVEMNQIPKENQGEAKILRMPTFVEMVEQVWRKL